MDQLTQFPIYFFWQCSTEVATLYIAILELNPLVKKPKSVPALAGIKYQCVWFVVGLLSVGFFMLIFLSHFIIFEF
jgi:hypothetical protein